jgi:Dynamin family
MDREPARRCCERLLAEPHLEPVRAEIERIARRLDEPLCVAVSGRVSAGKSTLVNAFIGRRIAPMGEGEVTEANCWFRHVDQADPPGEERAVVRRPKSKKAGSDGEPSTEVEDVPIDALPELTDIERDHTEAVTVYLDVDILRDLTVVDTPGLFSPNRDKSERTEKLLRKRTIKAARRADAVIYVTTFLSADDVGELEGFSTLAGQVAESPTNALLVMNAQWGLDTQAAAGAAADPLTQGQAHLDSHADWMHPLVWDQRVVFAPLAEVALTREGVTRQTIEDLRLVGASTSRRSLLDSAQGFCRPNRLPEVPVERRTEMIKRLQLYGLHEAVRLAERGKVGEAKLRSGLLRASGFEAVARLVDETFRARNDLLVTDSVLSELEEVALLGCGELPEDAAELMLDEIDRTRKRALNNEFRRLRALRLSMDQEIPFAAEARAALRSLFSEPDPERALRGVREPGRQSDAERNSRYSRHAGRMKARWQAVAGAQTSPARRWVANQAVDAYDELERRFHRAAVSSESASPDETHPVSAAVAPATGEE